MCAKRSQLLILALILVALGSLAVLVSSRSGSDVVATASQGSADVVEFETLRAAVEHLEAELEIERVARADLTREIEALRDEIAAIPDGRSVAALALDPEAAVSSGSEPAPVSAPDDPRASSRLGDEELLDAGFTRSEVAAFRDRMDDIRLERLYLRDRAAREGWLATRRYMEESRALDDQLSGTREEFGDELYDWAMYSTGRANRVQVTEVMEGSAAAEAGLAPGDVIYSYADRRIFSGGELRDETTAGTAGETTPVDVVRDGESLRVYVPRGPLGIIIEPSSQEPARVR
jgi:hypothetical protein